MTSSFHRRSSRRGFTLVELLVVIGIIVLLISILLPMVNRAYRQAIRTSMQTDLQVISQALEAYKNDFGVYPRPDGTILSTSKWPGSVILCWALVAPGPAEEDGADGPGFRRFPVTRNIPPQGQVFGPYLPSDRFKIGADDGRGNIQPVTSATAYHDQSDVLLDRLGHPILYFVRNGGAVVKDLNSYVAAVTYDVQPGQAPRYNATDGFVNSGMSFNGVANMQAFMPGVGFNIDPMTGKRQLAFPGPPADLPYLLWSVGPDGQFGTDDDVTNFR